MNHWLNTLFLGVMTLASAQMYMLDPTFAGDGIFNVWGIAAIPMPIRMIEIDGNYFIGDRQTTHKINSTGTTKTYYPVPFTPVGNSPWFYNTKFIGDHIYKLGTSNVNDNDILILKLDHDLNPVEEFGINGAVVIDFGLNEFACDLTLTARVIFFAQAPENN